MKDNAFARAVSRDDMQQGAILLGIPIEAHIENCLRAMQQSASTLGLEGTAQPPEGVGLRMSNEPA